MSSFLMGYPHPHFQGPIGGGGGPAIEPKFPPTEDYLSPYHHHHMHLNHHHHHHASMSPLHNGYAGSNGPVVAGHGNAIMPSNALQAVDYYGNGGASNGVANSGYSYAPPQSNGNYYGPGQPQQQQQPQHHHPHHPHHPPATANNPPTNVSPSAFAGNGNGSSGSNNAVQPSNLDAYNAGSLTEMASAPTTTSSSASSLNQHPMHPYSAATAAVPNAGLSSGGNSATGGGGANAALMNSYYSSYYGGPQVEPSNTALDLQELGECEAVFCRRESGS